MLRGLAAALLVSSLVAAVPSAGLTAESYRVSLVPFRLEAKLEGTFEPPAVAEVRLEPKRWLQFAVESAVPHGTRVGKGDVLVTLETEKIDEAIRDLEVSGRLAALAHGLLERDVALLEKSTPMQLEIARRNRRITAEDLARYEEKEAKLSAAANEMNLQFSEFRLQNAEEELAQLEKMYEQDDLTEESEEIVLKRARFEAEAARFFAEMARDQHERIAKLDLPRRLDAERRANAFATLELERAEGSLPVALDRLKLELEKSTNDRRKAAEYLAELKADRGRMPVTAPIDGVVYYGKWRQGKWTEVDVASNRLRAGGQLDPRDCFITIIGPGRLTVRAGIPEKDLARVPEGAAARVAPKAFPDVRLAAKVRSVTPVPVATGRFETLIDLVDEHPRLVAGMEAEIRVIADHKADALAVPKKAVFVEEAADEKRYVYIAAAEGREPVKRSVAVGRSNDELVEITAGLSVGEEILLEKPGAKPAAAPATKVEAPKAEPPKAEPAKPVAAPPAAVPQPAASKAPTSQPTPPKQDAAGKPAAETK